MGKERKRQEEGGRRGVNSYQLVTAGAGTVKEEAHTGTALPILTIIMSDARNWAL